MEDVARRGGVGRATLYRRFPTKAALNDALVLAEVRRYLQGSAEARSQATTFEDRMAYSTMFSVTFMRDHTLLRNLLRTEPETILPSLTIDAGAIIDYASEHTVALLRSELYDTTATTPAQERHLRTVAERHATDVVVHRDPAHQHQAGHHRRHPCLRAQLSDANDHRSQLSRSAKRHRYAGKVRAPCSSGRRSVFTR
jgi:AcrR family transcriptional regulator